MQKSPCKNVCKKLIKRKEVAMKNYKDPKQKKQEDPQKQPREKQEYNIHEKNNKKIPQRIWPSDQEKHKGPRV